MATKTLMKHTQTGIVKTGAYGFSWTYLFFGAFVPIFRGEIRIGLLHLLFGALLFFVLFAVSMLLTGFFLTGWMVLVEEVILLQRGEGEPMPWGIIFWCLALILVVLRVIISSIYNTHYMTRMLTNGWELADTDNENSEAKTALNISVT